MQNYNFPAIPQNLPYYKIKIYNNTVNVVN